MIAASDYGLGWVIFDAKEFLQADVMMASIVVIGVIGFVFERVVFGRSRRHDPALGHGADGQGVAHGPGPANDPVLWRIDARGVARVTLNRPQVSNAYDGALIAALLKTYDALAAKPLRAVVITGKGRNFQAGADINWLDAVRRSSPQDNLDASRMTAEAVQRLNLLPVPT